MNLNHSRKSHTIETAILKPVGLDKLSEEDTTVFNSLSELPPT